MSNLENSNFTYSYLSSVLPKDLTISLVQCISHWIKHKGVEWTVSRLKDLKVQYLNYLSGNKSFSLVKTHRDGTPYGAFRPLWKLKKDKVLISLNIYTSCILKDVSKRQRSKFENSVTESKTDIGRFQVHHHSIPKDVNGVDFVNFLSWINSRSKRAPYFDDDDQISTVCESARHILYLIENLMYNTTSSILIKRYADLFWRALYLPNKVSFMEMFPDARHFTNDPNLFKDHLKTPIAGKIGLIQERGAKLRAVANPFRPYQAVLTPLGDFLRKILVDLPWDCTFDQSKGIKFATESLQQSKVVYSIDLSDATNRFPLEVQYNFVKELIQEYYPKSGSLRSEKVNYLTRCSQQDLLDSLDLFNTLAKARWAYRDGYISWKQGQPLGLYPSFWMFSVTHGFILENIESQNGLSDTFRILGDDVIITNKDVSDQYIETMTSLGCKIASDKTICSNTIAEFAGKVISKEGVIPFEKWKNYSKTNPLGPIACLGYKGLKFIPKHVRKKVAYFASLPEPIGFGLNPKGIPLSVRMSDDIVQWWYKQPSPSHVSSYDYAYRKEYALSFWNHVLISPVDSRFSIGEVSQASPFDRMDKPDRSNEPTLFMNITHHEQLYLDHINAVNKCINFEGDLELKSSAKNLPRRGDPRPDKQMPKNSIWKRIKKVWNDAKIAKVK